MNVYHLRTNYFILNCFILFINLKIIHILPVMTFFIALIGPKVTRFLLNAASPLR